MIDLEHYNRLSRELLENQQEVAATLDRAIEALENLGFRVDPAGPDASESGEVTITLGRTDLWARRGQLPYVHNLIAALPEGWDVRNNEVDPSTVDVLIEGKLLDGLKGYEWEQAARKVEKIRRALDS